MPIPKLTIIGERINPGFASSKAMLDGGDIAGLQRLAQNQVRDGARYLTINVGDRAERDHDFLREVIQAVQAVADVPLSFDYPSAAVQEVCLKAYDPAKARGAKPIINSVSELRWEMLEVLAIQPAKVVLMASERLEDGEEVANNSAREIADTAARMVRIITSNGHGLMSDDLLIDVSLCPIASDTEGRTRRAIDAIRLVGADPSFRGVHILVGLSNLGVMLPKLALDGSRLNVKVESAFLTLTMPHGLDTILGTPGRDYQILPPDDFVLRGFQHAIAADDAFETIDRIQALYQRSN